MKELLIGIIGVLLIVLVLTGELIKITIIEPKIEEYVKGKEMEQYTIDGNIEEINFLQKEKKPNNKKLTIKEKFRSIFGIRKDVKCKDCKFFIRINGNNKYYYKCQIMGISSSSATDIRLKDYGCENYMKEEN